MFFPSFPKPARSKPSHQAATSQQPPPRHCQAALMRRRTAGRKAAIEQSRPVGSANSGNGHGEAFADL